MSVTEFNMWIAYFDLKKEEQDRQNRIAQSKRRAGNINGGGARLLA